MKFLLLLFLTFLVALKADSDLAPRHHRPSRNSTRRSLIRPKAVIRDDGGIFVDSTTFENENGYSFQQMAVVDVDEAVGDLLNNLIGPALDLALGTSGAITHVLNELDPFEFIFEKIASVQIVQTLSATATGDLILDATSSTDANVDATVFFMSTPGDAQVGYFQDLFDTTLNDLLGGIAPPTTAFAYFSADAHLGGTLSQLRGNMDFAGEAFAMAMVYKAIVEYQDSDGDGAYSEGVDAMLQEYDLGTATWNAMEEWRYYVGDVTVFQFSAATRDGVFNISYSTSNRPVMLVDGSILTPNSTKTDVHINNFPYAGQQSRLALLTYYGQADASAQVQSSAAITLSKYGTVLAQAVDAAAAQQGIDVYAVATALRNLQSVVLTTFGAENLDWTAIIGNAESCGWYGDVVLGVCLRTDCPSGWTQLTTAEDSVDAAFGDECKISGAKSYCCPGNYLGQLSSMNATQLLTFVKDAKAAVDMALTAINNPHGSFNISEFASGVITAAKAENPALKGYVSWVSEVTTDTTGGRVVANGAAQGDSTGCGFMANLVMSAGYKNFRKVYYSFVTDLPNAQMVHWDPSIGFGEQPLVCPPEVCTTQGLDASSAFVDVKVDNQNGFALSELAVIDVDKAVGDRLEQFVITALNDATGIATMAQTVLANMDPFEVLFDKIASIRLVQTLGVYANSSAPAIGSGVAEAEVDATVFFLSTPGNGKLGFLADLFGTSLNEILGGIAPPTVAFAYFSADAQLGGNLRELSANINLDAEAFAMAMVFRSIIEFSDVDGDGAFTEGVDVQVSSYDLATAQWYEMTDYTFVLEDKTVYAFNASTRDNVFAISYMTSTRPLAAVSGTVLTPNSTKVDITITNYPYQGTASKLALMTYYGQADAAGGAAAESTVSQELDNLSTQLNTYVSQLQGGATDLYSVYNALNQLKNIDLVQFGMLNIDVSALIGGAGASTSECGWYGEGELVCRNADCPTNYVQVSTDDCFISGYKAQCCKQLTGMESISAADLIAQLTTLITNATSIASQLNPHGVISAAEDTAIRAQKRADPSLQGYINWVDTADADGAAAEVKATGGATATAGQVGFVASFALTASYRQFEKIYYSFDTPDTNPALVYWDPSIGFGEESGEVVCTGDECSDDDGDDDGDGDGDNDGEGDGSSSSGSSIVPMVAGGVGAAAVVAGVAGVVVYRRRAGSSKLVSKNSGNSSGNSRGAKATGKRMFNLPFGPKNGKQTETEMARLDSFSIV
eukprot:TRINITY_DN2553_c0_g1::TRINITY_DN2553_c0_g1_i1::g.19400::m.19400 TRINITY_DN2553_c0_g1::TRINITY_DN2553_c0_g1_i1::g.19400  ORF type:complete len:1256 (-),score=423.56,NCU-G1/PF15065.1/4.5e-06,NCU-G1/PF15065.1/9.9e-10,CPW_WPC/PF09717.5/1.3e+02,CPW_WPC/PF09717.5/10,Hydrophobin_2/PF06766.6/5,Hydrophobin_2/PF06766.6/99 TRINITY_DN2553_c0_g1_i1:301-4038(-)